MGSTIESRTTTDLLSIPYIKFNVNFSSNGWSFEKADKLLEADLQGGISWLDGVDLDGWLINFRLDDGTHLYVPCFEYFTRCYGHSSELRRVLLTYPWQELERRIFRPPGRHSKTTGERWHVDLGPKMVLADTVFLAHIRYDVFAGNHAKRLYAEREALWVENRGDTPLKVGPWFEGPGQLKVRGLWISPESFLAIRVDGSSDPAGPPVSYTMAERPDEVERAERQNELGASTPPRARSGRARGELSVHADRGPDPTTGYSVAEGSDFEKLGQPREVRRARRIHEAESGPESYVPVEKPESWATGEPGESGSGIGELVVRTPVVYAGEGVLLDMWKAFRRLREEFPDFLETVQWFSLAQGFSDEDPPILNGVPTPGPTDEGSPGVAHGWCWITPGAAIDEARPRGVLAVRIRAQGRDFCVLEIQRRPRGVDKEEQITGLVFPFENPNELGSLLYPILSVLPAANGVFAKIPQSCPSGSKVFRHSNARNQWFACEAATRNALAKMGIRLPKKR